MKKIDPKKVFGEYRNRVRMTIPIIGRKYTMTHSDETADLFVVIGMEYALDKINDTRDEVRLEWVKTENGYELQGTVLIDGEGVSGNPFFRNQIFIREMPTALQAIRYADRALFEKHPTLDEAPVRIQFVSSIPKYNKVHEFGKIGQYKI